LDASGTFHVDKAVPVLGAIAILPKSNIGKRHAGIVSAINWFLKKK